MLLLARICSTCRYWILPETSSCSFLEVSFGTSRCPPSHQATVCVSLSSFWGRFEPFARKSRGYIAHPLSSKQNLVSLSKFHPKSTIIQMWTACAPFSICNMLIGVTSGPPYVHHWCHSSETGPGPLVPRRLWVAPATFPWPGDWWTTSRLTWLPGVATFLRKCVACANFEVIWFVRSNICI